MSLNENRNTGELKLLNVQVFFRHGARTPLRYFEGIEEVAYEKNIHGAPVPHAEVPFEVVDLDTGGSRPHSKMDEIALKRFYKGGMTAGQLTTIGKEQVYQLGQRLKRRYIDELGFVSETFKPAEVYVRSSNVNRTLESLQCLIGGMYGVDQFKEKGPLVISVRHYEVDDIFPNTKNCKAFQEIGVKIAERLLEDSHYKAVMTKVQQITGRQDNFEMVMLFDHLVCRKTHGLRLEPWMIDMENDIHKAAVKYIHFYVGSAEHCEVAKPLSVGMVYNIIEDNMKAAIRQDSSTHKLHLYSCHDTTLFPLMMVLGHPMDHWPPYAADILYELYEDNDGKHWVQILFCDKEYVPHGCETSLITLTRFQEIIKHVKLNHDQYTRMCRDTETAKELYKTIFCSDDENDSKKLQ